MEVSSLFHRLSSQVSLEDLPGWGRVFGRADSPLAVRCDLADHEVLYPTDGPWLTEEQYRAVIVAVRDVGESEYLWAVVEASTHELVVNERYRCELPGWSAYRRQISLPLDATMWSPSGTWGVYVDHERYGLLGGSHQFVSAFRHALPLFLAARIELGSEWAMPHEELTTPDWFATLIRSRPPRGGDH
jgi:hypothetical protein